MRIPVTKARQVLADLVNRVAYGGEHVVLTRHGRVVAAIIPPEDLELLQRLREGRIDLSRADGGAAPQEGLDAPAPHGTPLRIAAEYRPPGFRR
ncbi:type II toxin-antitoxin system Phd/YefM family antitoxin [Thermomonospora cellulosilytica]|uniref:Antitoxin n=1 Tax=Thermomonospora cellulosilytica TaxID=1411118 RepID=A0A7W3RAZ5_9ACTN|nr:type II toxin-antitoxin system Phd/YefM family antitoxin [Thermomonospora cellulosilytica]MBA9005805.1 prevent-host-death family protein [Thermomonospora cellulosilytica]